MKAEKHSLKLSLSAKCILRKKAAVSPGYSALRASDDLTAAQPEP